jgi:NAD(P)-dependent dehydrogenase (short-subunit alcohol dehydrogenase family)
LPVISPAHTHHFFSCDVGDANQVTETIRKVEKTVGPIDICVNAAGVNFDNLLVRMRDEQIQEIINTNLVGSIFVSKAVARGMIQRNRGHIINIGSVVGIHGNAGQSVYSASKSGLSGIN